MNGSKCLTGMKAHIPRLLIDPINKFHHLLYGDTNVGGSLFLDRVSRIDDGMPMLVINVKVVYNSIQNKVSCFYWKLFSTRREFRK
mgnify:CR=1 FL=1